MGELTFFIELSHGLYDCFGVFVVIGLQVGAAWETVAYVFPAGGSSGANPIDCFVSAIACGKDSFAWFVVLRENVLGLHGTWFSDTCKTETGGCQIDMFNEIGSEATESIFRDAVAFC